VVSVISPCQRLTWGSDECNRADEREREAEACGRTDRGVAPVEAAVRLDDDRRGRRSLSCVRQNRDAERERGEDDDMHAHTLVQLGRAEVGKRPS
jgi:hypothetical protein